MKHIEDTKKAIVFTDIKDFTLKNSLLTQLQVRKFLNIHDWLVIPSIKKYNWKIIKTIWDAFLIIFDDAVDAIKASIEIQNRLRSYNKKTSYNLYKIELRIIINYGDVQKEQTIIWEDYFWDVINVTSRLQSQLGDNKIFVTSNVINELKEQDWIKFKYLWETSLRWILYKVGVYEIMFCDDKWSKRKLDDIIVTRNDILLTRELKDKLKEVYSTTTEFALITSVIWVQNIFQIWAYIMVPFHLFLLYKIATKFDVPIFKKDVDQIFLTAFFSLIWIFAIGQIGEYTMTTKLAVYWVYLAVMLNFWLTYILWKYLSNYFYVRSQEIENANKELKNMLK